MGTSTCSNHFQIQLVGEPRLKADRPGKHQKPRQRKEGDRGKMPLRVHVPIISDLSRCPSQQSNLLTKAETTAGPDQANIHLFEALTGNLNGRVP